MNGHLPIAGFLEPHTGMRYASARLLRLLGLTALVLQPNRKRQLLQQCARIGYTPHLRQSIKPIPFMIQGRRPRKCSQRFPTT